MELRQWLFIAGAVIILFVVVDAIRRARRARNDALEMSRQMGGDDSSPSPLDDDFNPELPGGGFRVLKTGNEQGLHHPREAPIHSTGEFDGASATAEEGIRANDDFRVDEEAFDDRPEQGQDSDSLENTRSLQRQTGVTDTSSYRTVTRPPREAGLRAEKQPILDEDFKNKFLKRITPIQLAKQKKSEERVAAGNRKNEIIVVNVISKEDNGFKGTQLLHLLEACGMEIGRMNIFHRHEHGLSEGPIQFSMANAVEPGTFPQGFEGTSIPGVCFFLQLPGPEDSMKAYEYMVETAQCLARNLGGEMRDERQSVMTGQTIEHGRQRVREFERRQLSVRT